MDMAVDLGEVDGRLVAIDAEFPGGAHGLRRFAGGDHRLGWHTAVIQAVAPHLAFLDQHHLGAHLSSSGSDAEAAGAGANDG